jgi:hypothetical protein
LNEYKIDVDILIGDVIFESVRKDSFKIIEKLKFQVGQTVIVSPLDTSDFDNPFSGRIISVKLINGKPIYTVRNSAKHRECQIITDCIAKQLTIKKVVEEEVN